jgi:hypothetical protein
VAAMRMDDFVAGGGGGRGSRGSGGGVATGASDALHHLMPPGAAGADGWPREVLRDDVSPARK